MTDIVVVGGANIDIKARATQRSIPGTSNPGAVTMAAGGVGRNIAHNLARLGASAALISIVGDDPFGEHVLDQTRMAGVDISRVSRGAFPTGSYVALLDHDGELITAINDMRCMDGLTPALIAPHESLLASARLVVADCNLPVETLRKVAFHADDRLVIEPISVPKSRKLLDVLAAHPIYLASPNLDQMEQLAGTRDIEEGVAVLHRRGLTNIVIHAGADGAYVSDGDTITHVASNVAGPVLDVTGAGDAAVSGLVIGLLRGNSLVKAAALGQKLAGRVIASPASTLE